MKFCSNSTFGIIIGGLNVAICIIGSIIAINYLIQKNTKENIMVLVLVIVACLIMCILSGLLILGIQKRRHQLMLPWITVSTFFYILFGIRLMCALMFIQISTDSFTRIAVVVFMCFLIIVMPALIFWAIFDLYDEIRKENIKNPDWETNCNTI